MFNSTVFSERLKAARVKKHISQAELAKAVGVSAATISSYETASGAKVPALDKAHAIAEALGVSLDWLCGGEEAGKVNITDFDTQTYLRSLVVVLTEMTNSFEEYPQVRRGNITINNDRIVYFIKQCVDLLKVYRNGTLTRELYETCVEKIISKYNDYVIEYDNFLTTEEAQAAYFSILDIAEAENYDIGPGVFKTTIEGHGYDFVSRDFEGFLSEKAIKKLRNEDKGGELNGGNNPQEE